MKLLVASKQKRALLKSLQEMLNAWFSVIGEPLTVTLEGEAITFDVTGFKIGPSKYSLEELEVFTLDQLTSLSKALQSEIVKYDETLDQLINEAARVAAKCKTYANLLLDQEEV